MKHTKPIFGIAVGVFAVFVGVLMWSTSALGWHRPLDTLEKQAS